MTCKREADQTSINVNSQLICFGWCALSVGLRGNKNAELNRRLTNGLGKTRSQNRTFG